MKSTPSSYFAWGSRLLVVSCLVAVVLFVFDAIFGGLLVGWLAVTLFDWRFRSLGGNMKTRWLNDYGRRLSGSPVWTTYKRRIRESAKTRVLFVGGTAVAITTVVVAASLILEGTPDQVDITWMTTILLAVSAAALGCGVWLIRDDPKSDTSS